MADKKNITGLINHNKELNNIIKEAIQDALFGLMKIKKYEDISITELCQKAGVSRMAFYNNYKSLDNVIRSIVIDLNNEILDDIGSPFKNSITLNWYLKLFYTVEKNKEFFKLMFNAGFKYSYLEMINDLVLNNKSMISLEEKNIRVLWAGGMVNTIIKWFDDNLLESPSELAEFCYNHLRFYNIHPSSSQISFF